MNNINNSDESDDNLMITTTKLRKKRQPLTIEVVRNIRKSFNKGCSAQEISRDESISLPTVYKVIDKICNGNVDSEITSNKSGPRKKNSSEAKTKLSQILLRSASYSQKELSEELASNGINRSQSSVSRLLKEMNYTRKRLVKIPEERNTIRNIDARQIYARQLEFVSDSNLVFLDETGINLNLSRNYGYSPKNAKAVRVCKNSRGRNVSCMVAIKNTGIVGYKIFDGSFNGDTFMDFINDILDYHFRLNVNDVLVMDNCSFHHRRDVIQLLTNKNINYRFLLAYSPQLNPIEEYFSHFKARLNSFPNLPSNRSELISRAGDILENETISFVGWFAHMRKYIDAALARQEFI